MKETTNAHVINGDWTGMNGWMWLLWKAVMTTIKRLMNKKGGRDEEKADKNKTKQAELHWCECRCTGTGRLNAV